MQVHKILTLMQVHKMIQIRKHEAKDTAEKYGFGFSKDAEEHLRQADKVPASSIDPAAGISAGSIDLAASISASSVEPFPTVIEPVYADETSLPPGHSLGSSEHSTRFPSPSDLANSISSSSEMEDIYHHPRTGIFSSSSYDADFGGTVTNLAPIVAVDPVPTKRVNTIHPQSQILRDLSSPVQTRGTLKTSKFGESTFFIHQKVWKLVPLPDGKLAIGTNWILKNKRDTRGIVVRNKARLVAQGHRQEEGIEYDEVFAPVPRIEAIRLFLAFASYMGFMVYVDDIIFGSTKKAWCDEFEVLMKGEFEMSVMVWRLQTTPLKLQSLNQDEPDDAVIVHLYRSMIGSFMYLTASRHDIMFAVYWYPRESPFVLEAYSDSDYVGSHGDRKSTTGGFITLMLIYEGGLALSSDYSWIEWPSFDD
ncbi:putative ribonuclease H-like domain-containing protein [Tanacetum coccineum]